MCVHMRKHTTNMVQSTFLSIPCVIVNYLASH